MSRIKRLPRPRPPSLGTQNVLIKEVAGAVGAVASFLIASSVLFNIEASVFVSEVVVAGGEEGACGGWLSNLNSSKDVRGSSLLVAEDSFFNGEEEGETVLVDADDDVVFLLPLGERGGGDRGLRNGEVVFLNDFLFLVDLGESGGEGCVKEMSLFESAVKVVSLLFPINSRIRF